MHEYKKKERQADEQTDGYEQTGNTDRCTRLTDNDKQTNKQTERQRDRQKGRNRSIGYCTLTDQDNVKEK
jgi:hypothetical protein